MPISIRQARPEDVSALVALDSVALDHPARAREIDGWVSSGAVVVAERNGDCVGYAAVRDSFFGRPFLEMVMVAESCRGEGIGRAFVRHVAGLSPGRILWASTNESNLPMRGLLTDEGFVPAGRIEGLDEGDPELVFRFGA